MKIIQKSNGLSDIELSQEELTNLKLNLLSILLDDSSSFEHRKKALEIAKKLENLKPIPKEEK